MNTAFFSKGDLVLGGHFSVAVITANQEDVEKLLAPYQENNNGSCHKEYLSFIYAANEYEKYENKEAYSSLEEFASDNGYVFDMGLNSYGRWENPNAKWDWYCIGGQYENLIPLKNGGRANCCKIGGIDLSVHKTAREKAANHWDTYIQPQGIIDTDVRARYFECYGDKTNYIDKHARFLTGALITPDGKWFQIGRNGNIHVKSSFAMVENYYFAFNRAMLETPPDYWLTVVDCHI